MHNLPYYHLPVVFLLYLTQPVVAADYHYSVSVADNLKYFDVELCFDSTPPDSLYSADEAGYTLFRNIRYKTTAAERVLTSSRNQLKLNQVKRGGCVAYTADFNGYTGHPWFASRQSHKQQLLVSLHQWLWYPAGNDRVNMFLHFQIPAGMHISVPGRLIEKNANHYTFALRRPSRNRDGRMAIGRFYQQQIQIGAATVDMNILNAYGKTDIKKLRTWVQANLQALQQIYNKLPVPDIQLLVVPVGADREPVLWGQAMRGGGDAVHLYVDEHRPLQEFLDDWVLTHELAHLLHPRISGNGNWLSEGLASYYQNVLRARAGLLTEQQAWNKLHAGFQRGIRGTPVDRTLAEVSENMARNHMFMRVYWSGAAISLIADTRLRMLTDNKVSLDSVLKKFSQCCLPAERAWQAYELMRKFDELSDSHVFTDLYKQYVHSAQFPDLQNTYRYLGLHIDGRAVELRDAAAYSALRKSIMQKIN